MGEKGGGGDGVASDTRVGRQECTVILVSISIYGGSGGCAVDASCVWANGCRVPRGTLDIYVFLQATV